MGFGVRDEDSLWEQEVITEHCPNSPAFPEGLDFSSSLLGRRSITSHVRAIGHSDSAGSPLCKTRSLERHGTQVGILSMLRYNTGSPGAHGSQDALI